MHQTPAASFMHQISLLKLLLFSEKTDFPQTYILHKSSIRLSHCDFEKHNQVFNIPQCYINGKI